MFRHTSILLMSVVVSLPAWAGPTVQSVEPQVLINRGQGYKLVTGATEASTGDKVMARPGGRGKLVYANGCVVDIYPGNVMSVPEKCYQPMRAGLEVPVEEARPVPWVPFALGAAVIGVGICAVADCFGDDDGRPGKPPRSP